MRIAPVDEPNSMFGPRVKPTFRYLITAIVLVSLTGCGGGSSKPDPTQEPAPSATATLSPGGVTVGSILDQIDTAWAATHSWQVTSWTQQGDVTSTPPVDGQVTVELVIPSVGRLITMHNNGIVVDEQMLAGGHVYMKGRMVPAAVAPNLDTETWVEVDPRTGTSSSPIAAQVAYLMSPMTSPFTATLPETRAQEATNTGSIELRGRSCTVWSFGNRESGIAYQLAVDSHYLPCQMIESASGYANVTTFAFNLPGASITAPQVATPPAP